mgnify:CR=1 FL=1
MFTPIFPPIPLMPLQTPRTPPVSPTHLGKGLGTVFMTPATGNLGVFSPQIPPLLLGLERHDLFKKISRYATTLRNSLTEIRKNTKESGLNGGTEERQEGG